MAWGLDMGGHIEYCGVHHQRGRACCCGVLWNKSMICHPCREGQCSNCVDGDNIHGDGRWCCCQHRDREQQWTVRPYSTVEDSDTSNELSSVHRPTVGDVVST